MKAIIPCAGFGTRFNGVPKPLLNINNGEVILDRLLEKINCDTYLITNALSNHLFESRYSNMDNVHISCNGLLSPTINDGCLINIQNLIKDQNINDDIIIIVGDIIFDFPLDEIIDKFKTSNTITIPVKEYPKEILKEKSAISGGLTLNKYNVIDTFVEHKEYEKATHVELGIYLISKDYLSLIHECIENYTGDAPGYLIEYAFQSRPIYGQIIKENWHHIVTREDYLSYLDHQCSQCK